MKAIGVALCGQRKVSFFICVRSNLEFHTPTLAAALRRGAVCVRSNLAIHTPTLAAALRR